MSTIKNIYDKIVRGKMSTDKNFHNKVVRGKNVHNLKCPQYKKVQKAKQFLFLKFLTNTFQNLHIFTLHYSQKYKNTKYEIYNWTKIKSFEIMVNINYINGSDNKHTMYLSTLNSFLNTDTCCKFTKEIVELLDTKYKIHND